jgi:hypothetical protein
MMTQSRPEILLPRRSEPCEAPSRPGANPDLVSNAHETMRRWACRELSEESAPEVHICVKEYILGVVDFSPPVFSPCLRDVTMGNSRCFICSARVSSDLEDFSCHDSKA